MEHMEEKREEEKKRPFDTFHKDFKTAHALAKLKLGKLESKLKEVKSSTGEPAGLDIAIADKESLEIMENLSGNLEEVEAILKKMPGDEIVDERDKKLLNSKLNNLFLRKSVLLSPNVSYTGLSELNEQIKDTLEKLAGKEKKE